MNTQTVTGETGGQEGAWIAFICALILLMGWLLLPHNQVKQAQSQVATFQVSIKDLGTKPLAMIADLRLAHEEIFYLYQEHGTWESTLKLEQAWISPFVKDKSWSHQGEHIWLKVAPGAYQGVAKSGQTNYLLNSRNAQVEIWLDLQGKATLLTVKGDTLQTSELIQAGWKQVVFDSNPTLTDNRH